MKRATIRDISNETGLSVGTVSKYLNGGTLKDANRKKIEEAIERLHYSVDEYARGLITNSTHTVGIILARLDNLFYSQIISQVEESLYKRGYTTIIRKSGYDIQLERKSIEWFVSHRVDALIIIPVGKTAADYEILDHIDIPVLFLDSDIHGVCCESIVTNNEEISYAATNYLIENGHKRIAVITDENNIYTSEKRLSGYRRALTEHGLMCDEARIYRIDQSFQSGYEAAKHIITETDSTAIFASNYISTVGAVYLLNELDIKVPQDISILGFDDIVITGLYRPKLTIINQPLGEIAELTVSRLMELLHEKGRIPNHKINVLNNQFILGESVAKIEE